MRGYECIVVTHPELSDESQKATVEKVHELIKKGDGTVIHYHLWGRRKLGYEVQKVNHGVYHLLYFTLPQEALSEIQQQFRYSDEIIKFQWVRVEDIEKENQRFLRILEETAETPSQKAETETPEKQEATEAKKAEASTQEKKEENTEEQASSEEASSEGDETSNDQAIEEAQ